ncbi:hypothetical protein JTE90_015054 [Oedothorax gibbosus]|uniref:Uncharacterized protein n=1 Tax=Oedothorax gibbosus TaxID=931172 RepID=A0AAV6U3A7_9ARAC|nr:hypothetical protein JTE90_015054 [Oedothorax gibbosus]
MLSTRRSVIVTNPFTNPTDAYMVESIVNFVIGLKGKRKYRKGSCIRERKSRNIADALVHIANGIQDHIRNFVEANRNEYHGFDDEDFNSMVDVLSKGLDLRHYRAISFVVHCCKISLLAAVMYDLDFNKAPVLAQQHILKIVGLYRSRNQFNESRWRYLNSAMFHYIIDNNAFSDRRSPVCPRLQ